MKGSKPLLLTLALLLALLPGCEKNNPSVLQLPNGTAAPDSQTQTTPAPLTPLGDRTCRVGQETIPESTLFSFVLNEAVFDPQQGLILRFTAANKSADHIAHTRNNTTYCCACRRPGCCTGCRLTCAPGFFLCCFQHFAQ